MLDISKRVDMDGLPYQFYAQFYTPEGELRAITIRQNFYGSVRDFCQQLHAVADAIDARFVRETAAWEAQQPPGDGA